MIHEPNLRVVDLFCGAGGLSLGFRSAGFEIVGGIDSDVSSVQTYSENFGPAKAIAADLSQVSSTEVAKSLGVSRVDVIVGGPPCQGFSVAGKRIESDNRNDLYRHYLDIVGELQPSAVVIENVPTIRSLYGGRVALEIEAGLLALGFEVATAVLNASHFGVPQARRRLFFVAVRSGLPHFTFPEPRSSAVVTCEDALSDLPSLAHEPGLPVTRYESKPATQYQRRMRRGSKLLYNHEAVLHKPETVRIISMVPDGGNYKSLPKHLHGTRKVNIAWTRMNSRKPSFTIDAGHNHHFHYSHNRVPTVRECARIQSFPDTFRFLGNRTSQYRQVGNAVPPRLAEAIAIEIKKVLT